MNNKIPAVEKTIALLELLAKLPEGATQAELKKELGISMSTAYRILQTLLKHKWIRKNADTKYSLDNGLLPLLYPFRNSMELLEHAQKVIDRVSAENEMACKLSIRRGTEPSHHHACGTGGAIRSDRTGRFKFSRDRRVRRRRAALWRER